ncbi:MAG: methylated-DNA--[protein]-cysteine S-methyltransferase [Thermodesulfovibrio sp.]|jgi:methylated-DNA-[protein]-cysteine S-methyltransferase|uniref:methylated-DNA--[protein]-cysteine S-methyltransferase n=2 Tax=Thermodesulfovibrio TaxID=28261 RepID=A0A2J6WKY4_9BACT|nr:MAG: methylated-DNA--[protein]-cysteine S-methyltransferase [Thermodesulfovibrio aggregans]
MYFACVKTPVGFLEILFDNSLAVTKISLTNLEKTCIPGIALNFVEQLNAYFVGKLSEFNYPVNIQNVSEFDRAVLDLTLKIPYAHTVTYNWIANKLNTSPRAVGQALKRNPLPIVIPCHRVIKSDGTTGGYSLGIEAKQWLIKHEKSVLLIKSY